MTKHNAFLALVRVAIIITLWLSNNEAKAYQEGSALIVRHHSAYKSEGAPTTSLPFLLLGFNPQVLLSHGCRHFPTSKTLKTSHS